MSPAGPLRRRLGRVRRRLRRARDRLRRPLDRPRHFLGEYALLSARPAVLHVADWTLSSRVNPIHAVFDGLRHLPAWFLIHPSWSHEDRPAGVERIRAWIAEHVRRHPGHRFVAVANTEREREAFEAGGVPAIFCNANAFADERVFRPLPDVVQHWDAVYDARLSPFKRHELAAAVESLALIVKPAAPADEVERAYRASVRRSLAKAHWFNGRDPADEGLLRHEDVNAALARCRVGLCLSAVEGQVRASIQYLLAGLPIVSTPSRGGRDVFFTPGHVRIVEPTPEAVAAGVRGLAAQRPAPEAVRAAALARMAPHRERLVGFVQAILDSRGEPRRYADEWPAAFRGFLLDPRALPRDVVARVLEAHAGGDGRAWPERG